MKYRSFEQVYSAELDVGQIRKRSWSRDSNPNPDPDPNYNIKEDSKSIKAVTTIHYYTGTVEQRKAVERMQYEARQVLA